MDWMGSGGVAYLGIGEGEVSAESEMWSGDVSAVKYDKVVAELKAAQAEVERLREATRAGWRSAAGWARRYWTSDTQSGPGGTEKELWAELEWARGVLGRYEMRMQEMANKIDRFEATARAWAEGRSPTFGELMAHRHIETERYEEPE